MNIEYCHEGKLSMNVHWRIDRSLMTPVENLRGNSLPGRLNQSQSRAASNVALSYLFNSMKRNTDIKCEKKIKSSKKKE
jgi:hypothetical protein